MSGIVYTEAACSVRQDRSASTHARTVPYRIQQKKHDIQYTAELIKYMQTLFKCGQELITKSTTIDDADLSYLSAKCQTSRLACRGGARANLTPFSQGFSVMMPYLASAASTGSSSSSSSS